MIVVNRFRVEDPASFRPRLEQALELLALQKGYVEGHIGRNVDDPSLWLLQTRWLGPGAYRRALGAYDVKVNAWDLLGTAIEEPSAYELLEPGEAGNEAGARGT